MVYTQIEAHHHCKQQVSTTPVRLKKTTGIYSYSRHKIGAPMQQPPSAQIANTLESKNLTK